ncbi:MAG: hypothetical protein HYW86_00200 [Candidatus Roizmanbacteria bacterium]|nr:MAG: hypothetical protein HYW86_00200 [Candidatus Roizmanbacteria bacterium]
MRKKIQEVIKQSVKQSLLDFAFFNLKILGLSILMILLYKNIVASQAVSSLYFKIFNPSIIGVEDKNATVEFLRKIQVLPEYGNYLIMALDNYGSKIKAEVNKDYFHRKQEIERLESALNKNPKSRDINLALSKLYETQGSKKQAQFYLEKAKEIDPTIK